MFVGRSGIHPGVTWDHFRAFSDIQGPRDLISGGEGERIQVSSQMCCPAPFKNGVMFRLGVSHCIPNQQTVIVSWPLMNASMCGRSSWRITKNLDYCTPQVNNAEKDASVGILEELRETIGSGLVCQSIFNDNFKQWESP